MTDRESLRRRGRAQHWWRRKTQAARGRLEWPAASAPPLRPPLSASVRSSAKAALCSQRSLTQCSSPTWCCTRSGKGMWPPRSAQTQSALFWLQHINRWVSMLTQHYAVGRGIHHVALSLHNKFLINTACLSSFNNF